MQFTEMQFDGARPVEGYGLGFFRIGGEVFEGALIVTAHGVRSWGGVEDIEPVVALVDEADVVFFGAGAEIAHAPAALRQAVEAAGFGIEAMSSPSACRTYNVLLSEGRRVALALLPV